MQREEHVAQVDTQRFDFVAVDLELDLGNAGIEAAVHEADLGTLARFGEKVLQDLRQLRGVRAAAVLQHEGEAAGSAQPADGRRVEDEHLRVLDLRVESSHQRAHEAVDRLGTRLALIPWLEADEGGPIVGNRLAGQQIETADVDDAIDTRHLARDTRERRHGGIGTLQRRRRREAHHCEHVALVLRWDESGRAIGNQSPNRNQQDAESQHDDDGVTLHDRHALDVAAA